MSTDPQAMDTLDRVPGGASGSREADLDFLARLVGMLLVAAALCAIPTLSRADSSEDGGASSEERTLPASPAQCQHMRNAMVRESGASTDKVVTSQAGPGFTVTTLFVSDGRVRITCNAETRRMSILRVVDQQQAAPAPGLVSQSMPDRGQS